MRSRLFFIIIGLLPASASAMPIIHHLSVNDTVNFLRSQAQTVVTFVGFSAMSYQHMMQVKKKPKRF